MELIKENVNSAINSLVGDMFQMNRILDRQMSVLSVQMVMPNTAKILHSKLAHAYPTLGDFLSDYQGSRNNLTIYPETSIGDEAYETPMEIFMLMLEKQLEIEDNVSEAIVFAYNEGDMVTKIKLKEFLSKITIYTEQILLLVDKFEMYKDCKKHWMDFDSAIEKFIII